MFSVWSLVAWLKQCCYLVASYPTIISSITDVCVQQGQNVSLTCKVIYNGTNLMPMKMAWYWARPTTRYGPYDRPEYYHITTNTSSVHQSTKTFLATVQTMGTYWCLVWLSRPTGLVLPGVQHQATDTRGSVYSPVFALQTLASKTVVYT